MINANEKINLYLRFYTRIGHNFEKNMAAPSASLSVEFHN